MHGTEYTSCHRVPSMPYYKVASGEHTLLIGAAGTSDNQIFRYAGVAPRRGGILNGKGHPKTLFRDSAIEYHVIAAIMNTI